MHLDDLLLYPMIVVIEDIYIPECAEDVLDTVRECSMDDIGAVVAAMAYHAEGQLMRN